MGALFEGCESLAMHTASGPPVVAIAPPTSTYAMAIELQPGYIYTQGRRRK
jgi:hypothetical protein